MLVSKDRTQGWHPIGLWLLPFPKASADHHEMLTIPTPVSYRECLSWSQLCARLS